MLNVRPDASKFRSFSQERRPLRSSRSYPASIINPLKEHLARVKLIHTQDLKNGKIPADATSRGSYKLLITDRRKIARGFMIVELDINLDEIRDRKYPHFRELRSFKASISDFRFFT